MDIPSETSYTQQGPRASAERLWHVATTVLAAALLTIFAYAHIHHWLASGKPTGLVFAAEESVLALLFVFRRRQTEASRSPIDWVAAFVGSFGTLLWRPSGVSVLDLDVFYLTLQGLGAALSAYAALHLARSFGIVAANRGVKVGGPYRFVRHPMYAAYLIMHIGYLLSALSLWNVAVIAVVYIAQLRRIVAEEHLLMRDPAYRAYAEGTRYRLIPPLF